MNCWKVLCRVTWRSSYIRSRNCFPLSSTLFISGFLVEFVLLIFLDFFAVLCFLLCFVCLRLVSFVPHVASVSGLSNSWSPFRFSLAFITILVSNYRLVSLSGSVVLCQILTWDYCVCCLGDWHDYVIQITWTISLSYIDDQSLSKVKSQWHKEICHHSTERI